MEEVITTQLQAEPKCNSIQYCIWYFNMYFKIHETASNTIFSDIQVLVNSQSFSYIVQIPDSRVYSTCSVRSGCWCLEYSSHR